jgi:signal transduction histidine kinase
MVEFAPGRVGLDADDLRRFPEYAATISEATEYYQIETADRSRLAKSPSLRKHAGDAARLAEHADDAGAFVQLPDGRRGRAVTIRTTPILDADELPEVGGKAPKIAITVAKPTSELDRFLTRLRWLLAGVCGIGAIVLLAATAGVIRRSLRPVGKLAGAIGAIGETELGARFDQSAVPRELSPIVARLNDLLGRLESAFDREKSFTADAAHELRTPLAGIKAALDVCATQRRDAAAYDRVVKDCLRVVNGMHAMIDNLLLLAQADADRVRCDTSTFDAAELLRETWSRQANRAREKQVKVAAAIPESLPVRTDPAKLALILNNVLQNAVNYVNHAGRIEISMESSTGANGGGNSVEIVVRNTGSRLTAGDAQRVFERFWRGDAARSNNSGTRNCGLGLAVCKKLAAVLNATIAAECDESSNTFTLRLRLPASTDARDAGNGAFQQRGDALADAEVIDHALDPVIARAGGAGGGDVGGAVAAGAHDDGDLLRGRVVVQRAHDR